MAKEKSPLADTYFDRKTRIDPSDPSDLALWGLVLGVSANEVLEASKAVGAEPEAVQVYLGQHQIGGKARGE